MSGPYAIAAVGYVLRDLLMKGLGDPDIDLSIFGGAASTVTAHPPDVISVGANEESQLNLFLYQVTPNAALRNSGLPSRASDGRERLTNPPLALDLHFLLTAYGATDFHREALLGYGMQILHEVPFLSRDMIRSALPIGIGNDVQQAFANAALADQIEYIKICPQITTTEELSKLWSAMQAKYRPSVAYAITVVLIEAKLAGRSALPVLKQGSTGRGPTAVGGLVPPYPEIDAVVLPKNQPVALLGDAIVIRGHDFAGENANAAAVDVVVRLTNDRWLSTPRDVVIPLNQRTATTVSLTLPNDPANLPAGTYTLSVVVTPSGEPLKSRSSNGAPLQIAPRITTAMPASFGSGDINLDISPDAQPGQRIALLIGGREILARTVETAGQILTFDVTSVPLGSYRVRVRVDGVDSLLIDRSDPKQPAFDETQKITIT